MAPSLDPFPELCLIAIFMHLPLSDLFAVVGLVCSRWRLLLPTLLARRNTLKIAHLVVGRLELVHLYGSELVYKVRRDDGSPLMVRPKVDTRNVVVVPNVAPPQTLTEPFTDGLMGSLPNITDLTVVCGQNMAQNMLPELFTQITRMLNHWQDSLVSLNLSICFNFDNRREESNFPFMRNLLESIDRLRSLRHLILDCNWPIVNFEPNFMIFSQLNTFTFRDSFTPNWITNSIQQYANQDVITQITITSMVRLDRLVEFTPEIASKFTFANCVSTPIAQYNIGSLDMIKTFCDHFTSVQCLSIRLTGDFLLSISPNLSQLQQLVHIRLTLFPGYHYGPRELTPIFSVRLLTIDMDKYDPRNSHQDFESCWMAELFPNVQVLRMFHNSHVCTDCGYEYQLNPFEDHPEILPKVDECKRLVRQALTRFPKLHTIRLEQSPGTSGGTLTDRDIFNSLEQL